MIHCCRTEESSAMASIVGANPILSRIAIFSKICDLAASVLAHFIPKEAQKVYSLISRVAVWISQKSLPLLDSLLMS